MFEEEEDADVSDPLVPSLQGRLLVASPQLRDPNFARSVVLMVQHDENGALGLILNRPLELKLNDAWGKVSAKPCLRDDPLHVGGPVEGPLMVVHTQESAGQITVAPGLYFTTETQDIEWIVRAHHGPARFFVGYAGWSPGQLEEEMKTGSWLAAQVQLQRVLGDSAGLWLDVLGEVDPPTAQLLRNPRIIPKDPSLN